MKATWEDTIIAESDKTVVVEGNHYFPPGFDQAGIFCAKRHPHDLPWKGIASYYHVRVGDKSNQDAAWYYPEPKEAAKSIKDHVAFWRGVKVSE